MNPTSPTHQLNGMRPTHQHILRHTKFLFFLLFVVTISGCSLGPHEGLIWDYRNENLEIALVDDKGQSLIDPTTDEGLALLDSISIDYEGKNYPLHDRIGRGLRATKEEYRDFFLRQNSGRYVLSFGEFQPNYKDLQVLYLNLPGKERRRISFTHTLKGNRFISSVWVDDELEPQTRELNNVIIHPKNNGEAFRVSKNAKAAPVTLYIYPRLADSCLYKDNLTNDLSIPRKEYSFYKISYRGKSYPLLEENKIDGLGLTTGNSRFLLPHQNNCKSPYLAFGPFRPEDDIHNAEIVVSYRGKEQTILLNCYLNEKEESVYEAWLGDENKKNIFYFRSGPLVEVDWR